MNTSSGPVDSGSPGDLVTEKADPNSYKLYTRPANWTGTWNDTTEVPMGGDDPWGIIIGLILGIVGLCLLIFLVIVILVLLCRYGCLRCSRPKKRSAKRKPVSLITRVNNYPSDTLTSASTYPNDSINSAATDTLLLPKNSSMSRKRPAPAVPPKPNNAGEPLDTDNLPTNIFARDFTIFPIDDEQDSSEVFSAGHERIEMAIGKGEIGIWEKTSHLTETIPADRTTQGLEELIAKFSQENRFSRDQKNDFVSCVVRDKFWDCAVEFRINQKKAAPFGRYGLVSKRSTQHGMRCTFAFWEVRLMLKEGNAGTAASQPQATPNWDKITENDIISYFRMRALSCLMFESEDEAAGEV